MSCIPCLFRKNNMKMKAKIISNGAILIRKEGDIYMDKIKE